MYTSFYIRGPLLKTLLVYILGRPNNVLCLCGSRIELTDRVKQGVVCFMFVFLVPCGNMSKFVLFICWRRQFVKNKANFRGRCAGRFPIPCPRCAVRVSELRQVGIGWETIIEMWHINKNLRLFKISFGDCIYKLTIWNYQFRKVEKSDLFPPSHPRSVRPITPEIWFRIALSCLSSRIFFINIVFSFELNCVKPTFSRSTTSTSNRPETKCFFYKVICIILILWTLNSKDDISVFWLIRLIVMIELIYNRFTLKNFSFFNATFCFIICFLLPKEARSTINKKCYDRTVEVQLPALLANYDRTDGPTDRPSNRRT